MVCVRPVLDFSRTDPPTALHAQDVALELLVVLNAASPDVVALVAEEVRGARVLHSEVDVGIAAPWNAAIAGARADRVVGAMVRRDGAASLDELPPVSDRAQPRPGRADGEGEAVTADEAAAAFAALRERVASLHRECPAPPAPVPDAQISAATKATATARRAALHEEFLEWLVAREERLSRGLVEVHERF